MSGHLAHYVYALVLVCSVRVNAFPLTARDTIPLDIKGYTALGDSYAAGIMAGDELDSNCWRYSDGYPGQLNRSSILGSDHSFDYRACSGALMQEASSSSSGSSKAVQKQIDGMSAADFVTVSIGGNDAGFFKLLDGCIFNFQGPASHTCQDELSTSLEFIASDDFAATYNGVMDAIIAKNTADTFRIFANGYSPFFDGSLSDDCNEKSLGYWGSYQPKLTVDVRRQLNDVCTKLNDRLGEIVKGRSDNKVIFVNWSHRFDEHRFCQPGKDIEDGDNTYFFDIASRTKSIGSIDVNTCQDKANASGDWGELADCAIAIAYSKDSSLEPVGGTISTNSDNPLGPGTARVFHPKTQGYAEIVAEIESVWPYTAAKAGDSPTMSCGAENIGGSTETLTGYLDSFCAQDLSVSHTQSYIDGNVEYTLAYKNPGSGYCNAANCKSTFESGLRRCEFNTHSIYRNGDASISCGAFSWEIGTAPNPSSPTCGKNYDAPLADVQSINSKLDQRGDSELCCSNGNGGCVNIETSGEVAVDLCTSSTSVLCVACGRLANYVAGLTGACQKDGMVGGAQDIVEATGLSVEI